MRNIPLGELTSQEFLRDFWQKKPLLIRNAIPDFQGLLTRDALMELACCEETQSRLIIQRNKKWLLKYGPLSERDFTKLPKKQWTLLVQEINHFLPSARDLLMQFSFIPCARLDDLMVSYAPKGGGVGPHFDSYDVFLLQGLGSRRWQISAQRDSRLIADAPLKILQNFYPEQEWVLQAGDMLYLPPNYAHNGVAEDECMTYSIGFRAPSHYELVTQFLVYLQDNIEVKGWYADPDLQLQDHSAEIGQAMLRQVSTILEKIKWDQKDIQNFLGIYLTEPKSHVFFEQPEHPLTQSLFLHKARKKGVLLDLKSRMLVGDKTIFMNGEVYKVSVDTYKLLARLADNCGIVLDLKCTEETEKILYQWYVNGYIVIES
mgnify:FL=1